MYERIKLTRGKYALVDAEDFEYLNLWKWSYLATGRKGYAMRAIGSRKSQRFILMHRKVLETPVDMQTYHLNGNGLDNRKKNLRICTKAQNMQNRGKNKNNTSGFKGVVWLAGKWCAQISVNHRHIHLGRFENKTEAALAYNLAAEKYFSKFAFVNII